jgi:hypothetical protein
MFDLFDDSQENRGEKTIGELFQEERGGASEPALASNETCHQEGSQTAVPFREEECSVPTWPAEASPVEAAVHDAGDGEERRACDEQGASTDEETLSRDEIEPEENPVPSEDVVQAAEEVYSASDLQSAVEKARMEISSESDERTRAIESRYAEILDDMRSQIKESVEAIEQRTVKLALQLARKIMNVAIEINPEYILTIVKDAVKVSGGATIKAVRVSPSDYEFISKLPASVVSKELDSQWAIEADESIRVGCVVETVAGTVDYDLDKACERIRESVSKIR